MIKTLLSGFLVLFLGVLSATAQLIPDTDGVIYVKVGGTGDGSSWTNATDKLQDAINATHVTMVWVAAGTYSATSGLSFSMMEGVKIYGGFAGTEAFLADRDPKTYVTTLQASQSTQVRVITNDNNGLTNAAVLDGFTITGGQYPPDGVGGGMYNNAVSPTINNCIFSGNSAQMGGGISNKASSPIISNCTFERNVAIELGAGIHNFASSPSINNCIFLMNSQSDRSQNGGSMVKGGAGIGNVSGSSPTISDCTFESNSAYGGGGVFSFSSSPSISNCSFTVNHATIGGAIEFIGNNGSYSPSITHCRFVGNNSISIGGAILLEESVSVPIINCAFLNNWTGQRFDFLSGNGGGIAMVSGSRTDIVNCTFVGNKAIERSAAIFPLNAGVWSMSNSIVFDSGTADVWTLNNWNNLKHNLIEGSSNTANGNIDATGIILQDIFTNSILLHLNEGSPAINKGNNSLYPGLDADTKDVDGNSRVYGFGCSNIDLGATEYQAPAAPPQPDIQGIIYVRTGSRGLGESWDCAYGDLDIALKTAGNLNGTNPGTVREIWVSAGVYMPPPLDIGALSFGLPAGVKIYGGFPATGSPTWADRNWKTHTTTLTTINNTVLQNDGPIPATVLDGFTVKTDANIGIANVFGASPTIRNCTFSGNQGQSIYNQDGSNPTIINCIFTGSRPSGIRNTRSSPTIINCTFSGLGRAGSPVSGAIYNGDASCSPTVVNCIILGNEKGIVENGSTTLVKNSLVQGIAADASAGNLDGNSIATAMVFVDAPGYENAPFAGGDYRLLACAPVIDKGSNVLFTDLDANTTDVAKTPRVYDYANGGIIDMGAYEYQAAAPVGNLAMESSEGTKTIVIGNNDILFAESAPCDLVIASVAPSGSAPLSGGITAKVWVQPMASQHPVNQSYYVRRHYELTPVTAPGSATARVTLYFTQSDFDNYNEAGSQPNPNPLPADANDATGKTHLKVFKYSGISSDDTGTPISYSSATPPVLIDPNDNDIVWNAVLQRWEVSFPVEGFSGFIVTTQNIALPVTLISFSSSLSAEEQSAELKWEVTEQVDISHYEVERSSNGKAFERIGKVASGPSPSGMYRYTDNSLPGSNIVYYRLKIVENDGSSSYSRMLSLAVPVSNRITLFPNPSKNEVWLKGKNTELVGTEASIIDMNGRILRTLAVTGLPQRLNIRGVPAGIYFIKTKGAVLRLMIE